MRSIARWTVFVLVLGLSCPSVVLGGGDRERDPFDLGERHYANREYRVTLQHYGKALRGNDVRAHYRMGRINEETGNDREALRHYRNYLELGRPGDWWDDASARVARLEELVAGQTTRSAALFERGKALYADGMYEEAEKVLLDAAKEDEENPEIHFYLGEVYMALRQYGKAETEYRKATEYY